MRLVFLYTADGQASPGTGPAFDLSLPATNHYALNIFEEGYFFMLAEMVKQKVVDEVLIVIESTRGTGALHFGAGLSLYVLPEINQLEPYLRPTDVIFCRHGFRSWFPLLERCYNAGHWMMLYGANGGRERWRIWNIILNDATGRTYIDQWGRLQVDFRKPVNTEIFNVKKRELHTRFNVMIGASHIHDKKRQHAVIDALIEYQKMYSVCPVCVLPGKFYRGEFTNTILQKIEKHGLDVTLPGMVTRAKLAELMQQTKLFIHLGSGQGDRGAIEAAHCGCQLMIGQPAYHHPMMTLNPYSAPCPESWGSPEVLARAINKVLQSEYNSIKSAEYFRNQFSLEHRTLPAMKTIMDYIKENKPDRIRGLWELL